MRKVEYEWYYDDDGELGRRRKKPDEREPMNEQLLYRILMFAFGALTVCAGIGTITVIVYGSLLTSFTMLGGGIAAAGLTAALGATAVYFGHREADHDKVFDNAIEREVLTHKQRSELRKARGGVYMRRARMEIEDEHDNIVRRELGE